MGIFDFFNKKPAPNKVTDLQQEVEDLKLALSRTVSNQNQIQAAVKERRKTLAKPLMYRTSTESGGLVGRNNAGEYIGPIYDLGEIARAIDVEPYVNQSVRKHREAILKEGFTFAGKDEEMITYVKNRLFEMELISGVTTAQVIREFTTNLVAYGTAFIVLKRDDERSSGAEIRMYGKTLDPMAAIYPMDPTSVSVYLNKHGHPVKWKQTIDSSTNPDRNTIFFEASDVIVATMDKKPGFVFGTPYVLPVLDDVRSLRRLEEIAEIISQKHAFPLYHFKVGEKDSPAMVLDDGTSEIDLVRNEAENLPTEGGIVTSHRVEIKNVGGETATMDVNPYLQYFESRVLAGLRLSELDLGRGNASKSSAQSISQGLEDSAKDFQAVIADILTNYLVLPILLEGGYDVTVENMVHFEFPMINREEERARQMHGTQMFAQDVMSTQEFRRDYLGKEPLGEEEIQDTMLEKKHAKDLALAKLQAEQAAAARKESQANKSASSASKTTSNAASPRNQHGTKPTRTRITANNSYAREDKLYKSIQRANMIDCQNFIADFISKHGVGGVSSSDDPLDCTTKEDELKALFDAYVTFSTKSAREYLEAIMASGCDNAMTQMDIIGAYAMPRKLKDRFFKNYIEKSLSKLSRLGIDLVQNDSVLAGISTGNLPAVSISSIFEQLIQELDYLVEKHTSMAYRYGFVRAAKSHGYKSIVFYPTSDTCDSCSDVDEVVISLATRDIPYSLLLNTHSDCKFLVGLGEK
jgi:hypothetical protein